MSRVDTGGQSSFNRAQGAGPAKTAGIKNTAPTQGVSNSWQIQSKAKLKQKERTKRGSKLSSICEVQDTDIAPLLGKKRQKIIADLTRILAELEQKDELQGEDEVSVLCKSMLHEHLRRLVLLPDTETDAEFLKGTA